jgi:hypothetical protein
MTPQPLALALFIFHLADLTEPLHLIGLAHGKLAKNEILAANKPFFDIYEKVSLDPQSKWLKVSKKLEKHIPKEYLEEMRP